MRAAYDKEFLKGFPDFHLQGFCDIFCDTANKATIAMMYFGGY